MKGECAMTTNKQEGPKDVCFCKDSAHVGDFRHMSKDSKITKKNH